jgi:hypothetical protein
MTMNDRSGDRQTVILVVTVAFGLAGGMLVIPIVDLDWYAWVLVVVTAAAVATGVAFWLLTNEHRPAPQHRPLGPPPPVTTTTTTTTRTATTTPTHVVLPTEAAGQWWARPGTPANNARDTQPAGSAPPLSTYVATGAALIAQCPNCGDFRLDVVRGEPAYGFRCRNPRCRHEWQWTPGTDWPAVVVRRNLTGEPR